MKKILGFLVLFVFAFLVVPNVVSAASISELNIRILALPQKGKAHNEVSSRYAAQLIGPSQGLEIETQDIPWPNYGAYSAGNTERIKVYLIEEDTWERDITSYIDDTTVIKFYTSEGVKEGHLDFDTDTWYAYFDYVIPDTSWDIKKVTFKDSDTDYTSGGVKLEDVTLNVDKGHELEIINVNEYTYQLIDDDKIFDKWTDGTNYYHAGDIITVTDDMVLEPVYKTDPRTVINELHINTNFDTALKNGGLTKDLKATVEEFDNEEIFIGLINSGFGIYEEASIVPDDYYVEFWVNLYDLDKVPSKNAKIYIDGVPLEEFEESEIFGYTKTNTNSSILIAAGSFEVSNDYTYKVLGRKNQEFTEGKVDSYIVKIDGDYSLFDQVTIDSLSLEKDTDYKVTEGSTIITFTESGITKLNTLVAGTYNVMVKYTNDKKVEDKIVIKEDIKSNNNNEEENKPNNTNQEEIKTGEITTKEEVKNPLTYDGIVCWIVLGFISIIGIVGTTIYRKKLVK